MVVDGDGVEPVDVDASDLGPDVGVVGPRLASLLLRCQLSRSDLLPGWMLGIEVLCHRAGSVFEGRCISPVVRRLLSHLVEAALDIRHDVVPLLAVHVVQQVMVLGNVVVHEVGHVGLQVVLLKAHVNQLFLVVSDQTLFLRFQLDLRPFVLVEVDARLEAVRVPRLGEGRSHPLLFHRHVELHFLSFEGLVVDTHAVVLKKLVVLLGQEA